MFMIAKMVVTYKAELLRLCRNTLPEMSTTLDVRHVGKKSFVRTQM